MSARTTFLLGLGLGLSALVVKLAYAAQRRIAPLRQPEMTDLNYAGREELEKLDLDAVAIDRIIDNRPYRNKLELLSRMIIPKALYGRIRHRIGTRALVPHPTEHARAA